MGTLLTLLLAAAPPLELQLVSEGGQRVELELRSADGGMAWTAASSASSDTFTTRCPPGGSVRATRFASDGGAATTRAALAGAATDVSCAVLVSCAADSAPSIFVERVATPPRGLVVRVVEADDTSGLATFLIENRTLEPLELGEATLEAELVPGWTDCPRLGPRRVPAGGSLRFELREVLCARRLSPTPHRRALMLTRGGVSYAFSFPFTPLAPRAPRQLFATERLDRIAVHLVSQRAALLSTTSEGSACACAGDIVGAEGHRLVLENGALCARRPDAGVCETLVRLDAREVGDFPELPPSYVPGRAR